MVSDRLRLVAAAWLATASVVPGVALGWGADGHRIVADVADDLLDAPTRQAVATLAGGETLADLSTWMDEERPRLAHALPGSAAWHYDDLPVCPGVTTDTCRDGNCATAALTRYRAVLADRHASAADRLLALRIVVHLLGDIHQPLHAADNQDRGGNEVPVAGPMSSLRDEPDRRPSRRDRRNLHEVWDVELVREAARHQSPAAFAAVLVDEHRRDRARLEQGTVADWVAESHRIARDEVYGPLPGFACGRVAHGAITLDARYREAGARVVRERLAVAGIRLAAVLKQALAPP